MRSNNLALCLLAIVALFTSAAFAGGPLVINPNTKTPYAYGPGTVNVYYDNGDLATGLWNYYVYPRKQVTLDNSVGKHLVEKGFADWSAVKTASFRATVAGDFASIGLPNITGANADLVIGKDVGDGIFVIFDADGTIMRNFFGVSSNVLGISSPAFAIDGTSILTASWTVLGGQTIDARDTTGANYQGVATHEFGHSINLAHTQTNGAAYFFRLYGESVGPASCTSLPYSTALTKNDVETMYPYSNPRIGGTGLGQANIHTVDDIAAISDLYPGPGWPNGYGTITGKILDTDGKTPLTGVNVIVRNLADPFAGANSSLSGELTQGRFGPDGTYTLHGLQPGGQYVVYVDAILAGGFPTPPMWFLPGPERFYDGPQPPKTDQFTSCQYQVITATAGGTTNADIQFERIKGAPVIYNLGYGSAVTDISGDGSTAYGSFGRGGAVFNWTAKTGIQSMNVPAAFANVYVSRNGQYAATNLIDQKNTDLGAFRFDSKNGWLGAANVGTCGTDRTYTWGVTNDGSVYGLAYKDCRNYQGFRWNPADGLSLLPTASTKADGTPANSRMNHVSADGSTIVGWELTTAQVTLSGKTYKWLGRVASFTRNGQPFLVRNGNGDTMSETSAVSSDGKLIAGWQYDGGEPYGAGWYRSVDTENLNYIGPINGTSRTVPLALSQDGSLMVGFAGNPWMDWNPGPFMYSQQLGMVDLNQFLKNQGANLETAGNNLWTPLAMSDDGSVIGGWAPGDLATFGWVLQMPKVFVCHMPPGNLTNAHTISVPFPQGMNQHLAHGDIVGPCQDYQQ
jgi:hypothetical protein